LLDTPQTAHFPIVDNSGRFGLPQRDGLRQTALKALKSGFFVVVDTNAAPSFAKA
jgi:hypothetical protein